MEEVEAIHKLEAKVSWSDYQGKSQSRILYAKIGYMALTPGVPIPAVSPDDMRRIWDIEMPADVKYLARLCSPGADAMAVGMRVTVLKLMLKVGLLDQWREADDSPQSKVLGVFATCSLVPSGGHLQMDREAILRALEE